MSTTLERVRKIVTSQIDIDEALVKEEARFIEDLNLDSLDTVELVMAFEEEFNCEIPDGEAAKIMTVNDAVTFIDKHKKKD